MLATRRVDLDSSIDYPFCQLIVVFAKSLQGNEHDAKLER